MQVEKETAVGVSGEQELRPTSNALTQRAAVFCFGAHTILLSRLLLLLLLVLLHVVQVAVGDSPDLEEHFGCKGPFWSRQYFFWHDGAPLTLIHEVFSNSLEVYLGPNKH